jgi:hypothetical protein
VTAQEYIKTQRQVPNPQDFHPAERPYTEMMTSKVTKVLRWHPAGGELWAIMPAETFGDFSVFVSTSSDKSDSTPPTQWFRALPVSCLQFSRGA